MGRKETAALWPSSAARLRRLVGPASGGAIRGWRQHAIRWVDRLRKTGSIGRARSAGIGRELAGEHRRWLLARIKEKDSTLRGLVAELARRGLKVDYRTVWNFVHDEKLSFKKSVVAAERDRPDVAPARTMDQVSGPHRSFRLVFIDETWTKTNMAPLRGWAPRGMRLVSKVPHGHWNTTTFMPLADAPKSSTAFRLIQVELYLRYARINWTDR